MNYPIIDFLGILTAVLLLIFSIFAFSYKKGNQLSHKILAAFLFANAMYIFDFALPAIIRVTGINFYWIRGYGSAFGFLFGPLLYVYSKSITANDFSLKPFHLVHFLLFVLVFLFVPLKIHIPYLYRYSVFHLQITPYMIACFVVIINYRKKIRNYYSSIDKLSLTWMLYVVGAFFIMWMVDLSTFILGNLKLLSSTGEIFLTFISLSINFIFAVFIFYKALQHPEIFTGAVQEEKQQKYGHSKLSETEKTEYLKNLENYFTSEKPFLNPELTISDVASNLNVSVKYLSQVINEHKRKNFYDFINSYRIEEAKKQLTTNSDSKKTVLEVLYESGFNSKSAFNTAFKKQTGFTPTQFRNQSTAN
jgi:AraC-like DNA-binding protein